MSVALFGILLGVFFTLAVYTFLYKENPYSRFAEYVFIGAATGYGIAYDLDWLKGQWVGVWSKTIGDSIAFVLALLLSVLWYFRFSKKYFFLYRIPLAITVGTSIGLALRGVVFAQVLEQVRATAALKVVGVDAWTAFNNFVTMLIVVCTLAYFTFTLKQEAAFWKPVNKFARYAMMIGFGAAYGYTVLTRMAVFIGRVQFLLGIPPNPVEAKMFFPWVALILLGTLLGYDYYKKTKK
ncbi:MAG: hypothetical protein LM601_03730 [Candidatus Verstraetearchaeota archaeon]|jgi:hypothetical protein|nr:hypothetical protein [Candidatus Verstraetearchaeota archaeon]